MSFFGTNIKKIRQVTGMSQKAFADLFKLNRGVIGAYEEGRSEPKIETLLTVVHHFNLDLDKFLTEPLEVNELKDPTSTESSLISDSENIHSAGNNKTDVPSINSLQKALANIDLIYEFTESTSLLSNYKIGDFLFLMRSDATDEKPETLLFVENGNLKYLSSVPKELWLEKEVYKIAGYLSFDQKNILSSILERIDKLERK